MTELIVVIALVAIVACVCAAAVAVIRSADGKTVMVQEQLLESNRLILRRFDLVVKYNNQFHDVQRAALEIEARGPDPVNQSSGGTMRLGLPRDDDPDVIGGEYAGL